MLLTTRAIGRSDRFYLAVLPKFLEQLVEQSFEILPIIDRREVTFMCARGPAPNLVCGWKTLQSMASLYKHIMGKP